jgi:hypothetical protein
MLDRNYGEEIQANKYPDTDEIWPLLSHGAACAGVGTLKSMCCPDGIHDIGKEVKIIYHDTSEAPVVM